MDRSEMLAVFVDESRDLLEQMEDILLRAEQGVPEADDTNALFRCAHTIKGSAGMFGFDAVVHFTHEVESVLDGLRKNTLTLSADLINVLLECQDHMARSLSDVLAGGTPDMAIEVPLIARLHDYSVALPALLTTATTGALVPERTKNTDDADTFTCQKACWLLSLNFDKDVMCDGNDPLKMIRYLRQLGDIVHIETLTTALPALQDANAESCYLGFDIQLESNVSQEEIEDVFAFVTNLSGIHIQKYLPPASEKAATDVLPQCAAETPVLNTLQPESMLTQQRLVADRRATDIKHLKVPSERLDALIDQVGEMVIAGAAAQLKAQKMHDNELNESIAHLLRLMEDVRDTSLCLRMTPIGEVFHRFPRVVRDLSRELGKDIELIVQGAETELDKSMVEKIADPLMHLVRNSLDHGIESPEERIAMGKRPKGRITLNANHESGNIVIEVRDDGAGLDVAKIRKKAAERGLIAPDTQLNDSQVWRLILEPGFSTAEKITNVSGRGVGMDVVKTAIEALRGALDIESVHGIGTTMRVSLPLTLAIIDGFQVGVGQNTFILPLDSVDACIELTPEKRAGDCIDLRGEVMPIVNLPALFDLKFTREQRSNIVVVRFAGRQVAIAVDQLRGECQAVIKPLGPLFEELRGIAGSTILGSGEVALVIDVPQLIQVASGIAGKSVNAAMHYAVQRLH